ncbi:MAG: AI-2E family transporter [Streptosporangiaceae bacterium]|jgi:predicted PurR-regulated permease PerM|nr:AI-2E family transporter [Actinomycetota bacterium]
MDYMTGQRTAGEDPAAPAGSPGGDGGAAGRMRLAARSLRARAQAAASPPGSRQEADPDRTADGEQAHAAPAADPAAPDAQVPGPLRQAAAWSWRLLLVALVIYVAFRLAVDLRLVVLPLIAALLLTALLQPLTARLRRVGMTDLLATWCTFIAAIVVIAGVITLTANRVSADYPTLAAEVKHTATELQRALAGAPFHLHVPRLQRLTNELLHYLSQHKAVIAGTVLTGGKYAIELVTGLILVLFITFFLLKDGARIWSWLISGMRPEGQRRAGQAGTAAWQALTNYIRGTTAVAAIHAVFIGLALWLLGVPLLVPLIMLVFLAAYIPLVGILVVGALAILITLGTKGWIAAVILLAVFLVENQLESHLLQPLVVGRIVRLHPLGIILVLAVGGIIAGIPGAIVAVPAAAVITHAWPYLRGRDGGRAAGRGPEQ